MAKEYIMFVNSWGKEWGDPQNPGFGYMPKSYIEKGYVFNPVTMVDLPNGTYSQMQSQIFKLMEQIRVLIEAIKKKFGLK
jgi:C1A family cysteine protease